MTTLTLSLLAMLIFLTLMFGYVKGVRILSRGKTSKRGTKEWFLEYILAVVFATLAMIAFGSDLGLIGNE